MAVQHCWIRGYIMLIIESDCEKAILKNGNLHFGAYNQIRKICWWVQRLENISFTWTGRNTNQVADLLAKALIPNGNLFVCYYNVLTLIGHPLHEGLCKLHLILIKLVVIKKLCRLIFLTFNQILIHLSLLKVQYHKNKYLSITIRQKCFEIKL